MTTMRANILLSLVAFILAFHSGAMPVYAGTDRESVVIGRLTGTLHEPPHSLIGNSPLVGGDRGSVEFRGFRLVGTDGETFVIRPLGEGYFQQTLPPGEYTLVRKRRDRPSHKESDLTSILTFTVSGDSLVNLGTLGIVLQGKPEESRFRASSPSEGIYTYRYRYVRIEGEDASSAPLEGFRKKDSDAAAAYKDRIVTVNTEPADLVDSSRFTLRETVFKLPLLNKR